MSAFNFVLDDVHKKSYMRGTGNEVVENGYFFWKQVDGSITIQVIEVFNSKFGSLSGSFETSKYVNKISINSGPKAAVVGFAMVSFL